MEKHFVTYNQALSLKELGFDEPCMGKYDTKQGDEWLLNIYSGHLHTQFGKQNKACIAPLRSQVFEWGRKEYKIHCSYGTTSDSREEVNGYCISNFIDGNRNYLHIDWEVGSYEEAESACIDKLIEIIKNNLDK
jgi:hypothetical protein